MNKGFHETITGLQKIDRNFSTIKSEISTISDKFGIMDEYVVRTTFKEYRQ